MSKRLFKALKAALEDVIAHQRGEIKLHCETFIVPDPETSDRPQYDTKKTSRKRQKSVKNSSR